MQVANLSEEEGEGTENDDREERKERIVHSPATVRHRKEGG